jgi:hypothetical protein
MATHQVLQQSVFHPSYLISINTLAAQETVKLVSHFTTFLASELASTRKQLKVSKQPLEPVSIFQNKNLC